jgi:acetyltransferase-like isoleucine patch superfamily enzyme
MKRILINLDFIIKPIAKLFFSIFYDKKYLKGRLFDDEYGGYFICFKSIWQRNILRLAKTYPWPVGLTCHISSVNNIDFHVDDLNNFQSPGTYFQNFKGKITLGKGCYIAPNVGIITVNHDLNNLRKHTIAENVELGTECWIGMNSVILPGVTLGAKTIVAAGSVVTKSFPQGCVVIGGTPAKVIKQIN